MKLSTVKVILSHGIRTPMIPRQHLRSPSNNDIEYLRWFVGYIFGMKVTIKNGWTCDKWLAIKGLTINGPDTRHLLKDCHHFCLSRNCGLVSYAIDTQIAWSETGLGRPLIHICLQDPEADIPPWRNGVALEVAEVHLPKYALPWLEYLLSHEADVEAKDHRNGGTTAIMTAALNSIEPAIDLLIRHGADVNATDRTGFTALHAACISSNRVNIITKLIANEAQVDALDSMDNSPLFFICRTITSEHHDKFLETIELLLTHGANPNRRTAKTHFQSALEIAFRNGYLSAVRLIISKSKLKLTPSLIWSLFKVAMETSDLSQLRVLLLLDKQNFLLRGTAALMKLIKSDKQTTEAAMLLLEKGALCHKKLVFWIVSHQKGNDLLRKVLERGISPNVIVIGPKRCPLLEALKIRDVLTRRAYVKSLVEYGANITMSLYSAETVPIYAYIISPSILPRTETVLDALFSPGSFQQVPEYQQINFLVLACHLTHVKVLQKLLEITTGSVIQRFVQYFIENFTATPFITRLLDITGYPLVAQNNFTVEHMDIAISTLDVFARYHTFWDFQPSPESARAMDTLENLMVVTRNSTPGQRGASFYLRKRIRIVNSSAESPQVLILPRADLNEYPQGHITIHSLGSTLRPTLDGR